MIGRDFEQRFLDIGIVKMNHAAVCAMLVLYSETHTGLILSVNLPVWCITTIVPGAPMVCKTAKVLIASRVLPPAFRTMVASELLLAQAILILRFADMTYLERRRFLEFGMGSNVGQNRR